MKLDAGDKIALWTVGIAALVFLSFWGTVGYVVLHFIGKFW